MTQPLEPVTLSGRVVRLEPLSPDHAEAIAVAGSVDRSSYGWTTVPGDRDSAVSYIEGLLQQHANGEVLPFVQVSAGTGEVLGCTRFLEPKWWSGRQYPDEIEIGGTWLTSSAQRTGVNTEAKLLLLIHAFDVYEVGRVAICTDARNTASRTAIERIGGQLDGILRDNRMAQGHLGAPDRKPAPRNTAVYSITTPDWPQVRTHLSTLRQRKRAGA